jgi:hypothetical protein
MVLMTKMIAKSFAWHDLSKETPSQKSWIGFSARPINGNRATVNFISRFEAVSSGIVKSESLGSGIKLRSPLCG